MAPDSPSWNDVWALFLKYHHALHRIGTTIAARDPRLPGDEIPDLLHAFALEKLPRIALLTQGMPPDEQGRYVRASYRNFLRDYARTAAGHEKSLEQLAIELSRTKTMIQEGLDDSDTVHPYQISNDLREKLSDALSELSMKKAKAVAMFLGLDNGPRSVREIARELHTTRYAAKHAVLDGLLGIALLLGRRGILGDREVEACRLIILDGRSVADAARILKLTQHQVRTALEIARSVVVVILRSR